MQENTLEFFNAIKKGNQQAVEAVLDSQPELASAHDSGGMSAVLTAIYYQQPKIADLLINRGASLNLFEASAAGRADDVITHLESAPQDVNAWSTDGFQPLGLASFFGHTALVKTLLERGAEVSAPSHNQLNVQPLHSAVAGQHFEIARMLLEHGANPNARQSGGFTPLHGAAQNGQAAMILLLLEHGADPNAADDSGALPAALAQAGGFTEAVELLTNDKPD